MPSVAEKLGVFASATVSLQTFPLFVGYMILVLVSGVWQRYTRPIKLRWILVVYNLSLSLLSLFTLYHFVRGLQVAPHIYHKEPTPHLRFTFRLYWITKIIELMDTVFMLLRHKSRQITFLHIYHHASMLLLSDYAYHVTPWPAIGFILAINSFVHVVLYWYYGVSVVNAEAVMSLKPRLTELQIFQFFIDFIYAFYGYAHHGFCVYGILYGILMTVLFVNFYYRAYLKPRNKKPQADAKLKDS